MLRTLGRAITVGNNEWPERHRWFAILIGELADGDEGGKFGG